MFGVEVVGPPPDRVFRIAWDERARLNAEQRLVLEAILGPSGSLQSNGRAAMQQAVERAVRATSGSVARHLLGENLLHYGALIGHEDWFEKSRSAFTQAFAIDSTGRGPVGHLMDLAIAEGNRNELARWIRLSPRGEASLDAWRVYASAVVAGNPRDIRAARERFAQTGPSSFAGANTIIPRREMDSLLARMIAVARDEEARGFRIDFARQVVGNAGRPLRLAELQPPSPNVDDPRFNVDALISNPNDTVAERRLVGLVQRGVPTARPTDRWRPPCELALARLRQADTTDLDALLRRVREAPVSDAAAREAAVCVELASAIAASLRPGAGVASLERADSMMRFKVWLTLSGDMNPHWNYDLALAFARHQQWKSAAAAARRRLFGRPHRLSVMLRDEGRWAMLAGDTTTAIRALKQFLVLRELAEPPYVAERDSIKAVVAQAEASRAGRPRGAPPPRAAAEVRR
jgi:hypothetical protein